MSKSFAYGYVRVSTDKQEELSPDSQEKLLRDYAKKHDMILLNIFFELGVSGRKAEKRPEFQKMISSAKSKEHPVDAILVWKYSRFARNQEESIVYKSLLKKQNNVDVISVSEPLIDGPFGSLIERIIEWMDEYYSIRLSGEVFRGMKENALRGKYQARPPLGYRIVERGKPPVIVPEEAEIVKTIFLKYTEEHLSFFDIARYLNQLGCKTSHGKNFETRSIEYILKNPMYCGMLRWNRTTNETNEIKKESEWIITEGEQEAIISKELFEAAQKRFQSVYKPKGSRPSSTYKHWLSGLLKCPSCGRTLVATTLHRKNGEPYAYFQCYGYSKGKCTANSRVSSLLIGPTVLDALQQILDSKNISYSYVETDLSSKLDEKKLLLEKLTQLDSKEQRIKAAYQDGIDSLDEYKENKTALLEERKQLENQLLELQTRKRDTDADKELMLSRIRNTYEVITSDRFSNQQKNEALRTIIQKIVYIRDSDSLKIYYYLPVS